MIYALFVTLSDPDAGSRTRHADGKTVECEPGVVQAPKPKRVINVTPDYMDNSSHTDLTTILSRSRTPKMEEHPARPLETRGPAPSFIRSSGRDNRRPHAG